MCGEEPGSISPECPKDAFCTVCRLIAFLRSFGEQLHDNRRDGVWHIAKELARWYRLSCNMAMYPFHRIRSREGQTTGQHLVKRDAEGIEIAAGIDRTVHAAGLLGCHVGERSGAELGWFGQLAFTWKPRRDPKAHEPDL